MNTSAGGVNRGVNHEESFFVRSVLLVIYAPAEVITFLCADIRRSRLGASLVAVRFYSYLLFHLLRQKTLKSSRCAFIVEDDHPLAYKRYVSLAHSSYRIAFNKNGRPRTATRVPSGHHRSVLFVERRLTSQPANFSMRTRRHGHRNSFMKDPCGNANKLLLSKDWLKFWRQYCSKRKLRARKSAVR